MATTNNQTPETNTTAAKESKPTQSAEYTAQELADASVSVFGKGVSPDCVIAAFRVAGVTKATKSKAKEIVKEFMKKEVK